MSHRVRDAILCLLCARRENAMAAAGTRTVFIFLLSRRRRRRRVHFIRTYTSATSRLICRPISNVRAVCIACGEFSRWTGRRSRTRPAGPVANDDTFHALVDAKTITIMTWRVTAAGEMFVTHRRVSVVYACRGMGSIRNEFHAR